MANSDPPATGRLSFKLLDVILLMSVVALVAATYRVRDAYFQLKQRGQAIAKVQRRPAPGVGSTFQAVRLPISADGLGWYRIQARRPLKLAVSTFIDGQVITESLPIGPDTRIIGFNILGSSAGMSAPAISNGETMRQIEVSSEAVNNAMTIEVSIATSSFPVILGSSNPSNPSSPLMPSKAARQQNRTEFTIELN